MINFIFLCDGRTFKITGRGRIATGNSILLKSPIDRDNLYHLGKTSNTKFHSGGIDCQGSWAGGVGIPDDLVVELNDYIVG